MQQRATETETDLRAQLQAATERAERLSRQNATTEEARVELESQRLEATQNVERLT